MSLASVFLNAACIPIWSQLFISSNLVLLALWPVEGLATASCKSSKLFDTAAPAPVASCDITADMCPFKHTADEAFAKILWLHPYSMSSARLRLVHLTRIFLLAPFPKRIPVTLACAHRSPKLSRSFDLQTAVAPMLVIVSPILQTRDPILILGPAPEAAIPAPAPSLNKSSNLLKQSMLWAGLSASSLSSEVSSQTWFLKL